MQLKSNFGGALVSVHGMAKHSTRSVLVFTLLISLAPLLVPLFTEVPGWFSFVFPFWIPLCFFAFPTVHALCKVIVWLEERVDELEHDRNRAA